MVLESSTSVPGSKCLWNNVVSTLIWRVLSQPRGISPCGAAKSRGRRGQRVHDGPGVVRRRGPQGIEGRRHGSHNRPGARVRQAHMDPGDRGGLRVAERESSMLEPRRDLLPQRIAARDEDLVPAQRGGLLVAGGGGAG